MCVTFRLTLIDSEETHLPTSFSSEQLHQLARHGAVARLEEIRTEIASIDQLIRGGETAAADGPRNRPGRPGRRKRRTLSAAGRAAIAAAQKARWAKIKHTGRKRDAPDGTPKRKSMSASARKAISARMRTYWAKRRKAKTGTKK
jgi:hypothetical protein